MSISTLSPRRLAAGVGAASNSRAAKALDWVTALGFVAYAAYLLLLEWPAPTGWTLFVCATALVGVFLAAFDWKSRVRAAVGRRMRSRFTRRRA